jgi:hypothetical protein
VTMGGPAWPADLLAAITLVISGYCLGRLVVWRMRRRPTDVDVDLVHGAMGVGMAAMLVPGLSPVPNVTWAWAFGLAAAWLAGRIVSVYRRAGNARIALAHYVPHLVMVVAMIYMGAAPSGPTTSGAGIGGGGMELGGSGAGAHFALGALVLALFVFGYAVWLLDQLPGIATVRAWRAAPQPALAAAAVSAAVTAPVVRAAAAAHAAAAGDLVAGDPAVGGGDTSAAGEAPDRRVPLSPRLEAGCHIAMAVVMGYLLILMV